MLGKLLDIDIEVDKKASAITPVAGLIPFLQMCYGMGLPEVIDQELHVRFPNIGRSDSDYILSIIAMQIAEGTTMDDMAIFKEKSGLDSLFFNAPSPSGIREFLSHFHNAAEQEKQKQGSSYIPQKNDHLAGFDAIHPHIFQQAYNKEPLKIITLDQDATFIPTKVQNALYNYHGKKSYEAFNTYCPEYDMMVGTQFRDGNVSPAYGQLDELKRILSTLPDGIEKVKLRSDSASYQTELMKYCGEGENKRFGVIDFTISCSVTQGYKEAVQAVPEKEWKPILKEMQSGGMTITKETGQEYAEVNYVPQWIVDNKSEVEYRFLAIREVFEGKLSSRDVEEELKTSEVLENMEKKNEGLKKLHLTLMGEKVYKVFGMVTNMWEEDGGVLMKWHHERCGKSEEIHGILKNELAGGHVVSGKFGANAAWWNIAVMTISLLSLFKRYFLPKECKTRRPKALRFGFFIILGRIVKHARKQVLRVYAGKSSEWFIYARDRLMSFCTAVT
jgi:hypothetical protein